MTSMTVNWRAKREPCLSPGATLRHGAADGGSRDAATMLILRL